MNKTQIRNIVPHFVHDVQPHSIFDRITDFHVQIIEHRLNQLNLTIEQKLIIIDQIIANLKFKEI